MININLLPKYLRHVREPAYWRLIAIIFPLVVLSTLAAIQFSSSQTEANLQSEKLEKEARNQQLQVFIREQREVQNQLQQVRDLLAIAEQVKANQISWVSQINALLETLPAQGDGVRPNIDFQSLSMEAVVPPRSDPMSYEGQAVDAEMTISGNVVNTEVLAAFIRALERSDRFGVAFQSASRDSNSGIYSYSMTVGALAGDQQ